MEMCADEERGGRLPHLPFSLSAVRKQSKYEIDKE